MWIGTGRIPLLGVKAPEAVSCVCSEGPVAWERMQKINELDGKASRVNDLWEMIKSQEDVVEDPTPPDLKTPHKFEASSIERVDDGMVSLYVMYAHLNYDCPD